MTNITNLTRQHGEISEIVEQIKKLSKLDIIEQNAGAIALNISTLAGKLRIHLETEDKFLYPVLLESTDEKVRCIAEKYIAEMGNISAVFTDYKNKYNTKSKIMNNISAYISDSESVFNILVKRVAMENTELYPLLK